MLILNGEKITDQFGTGLKGTADLWNFGKKALQEQFFLENSWIGCFWSLKASLGY